MNLENFINDVKMMRQFQKYYEENPIRRHLVFKQGYEKKVDKALQDLNSLPYPTNVHGGGK